MPMLIIGDGWIEEHGDCSELKREIHIEKHGLKYIAYAYMGCDFQPINNGRLFYKKLLKDIDKYREKHSSFYHGYNSRIVHLRTVNIRQSRI